MRLPSGHVPDWQAHEEIVAAVYSLMGYTVVPNISVDGKQTDMICEKSVPGAGTLRIYVECKYSQMGKQDSVSNKEVDEFIAAYLSRREANRFSHGVMVANSSYTAHARAAAAKHPTVSLKTLDDLYEDVLALRSYLQIAIDSYENEGSFQTYIPLRGRKINSSGENLGAPKSLSRQVTMWLEDIDSPQMAILGDFGSGKTTFLRYMHFVSAKRYLSKGDCRIPILITLRDYHDVQNTADLVERLCLKEFGVKIPFRVFDRLLGMGKFLLLLDGFDEMGASSDKTVRRRNYVKLSGLLKENSKAILTCRPAYFVDRNELVSLFSELKEWERFAQPLTRGLTPETKAYAIVAEHLSTTVETTRLSDLFEAAGQHLSSTTYINLELFNPRQIAAYVRKREQDIVQRSGGRINASIILRRTKEVYDLEDLASRPILLKLIVDTLPLFHESMSGEFTVEIGDEVLKTHEITPAILYYVYTESELSREYAKGEVRRLVEKSSKRNILRQAASRMLGSSDLRLARQTLADTVNNQLQPRTEEQLEQYLTEIRTCSFLTTASDGSIRFTHKSFLEYYIADYLLTTFNSKHTAKEALSNLPLSMEVTYFLGDMLATLQRTPIALLHDVRTGLSNKNARDIVCAQNIINILNYARQPVTQLEGVNAEFIGYLGSSIRALQLEHCSIKTLAIRKSSVKSLDIMDSTVETMRIDRSKVAHVSVARTSIGSLVTFHVIDPGGFQLN